MIDLSKLTPAPLTARSKGQVTLHPSGQTITVPAHVVRLDKDDQGRNRTTMVADFHQSQADAEFHVIARNAFDIMMRRGWHASSEIKNDGTVQWWVCGLDCGHGGYDSMDYHDGEFEKYLTNTRWPDPFTAIVSAEAWYVANAEK